MPNHNSPFRSWTLNLVVLLVATIAVTSPGFGQKASGHEASAAAPVSPRITQAIDEGKLVKLARNTRPEANVKDDRGAVTDAFDVDHIFLLLQRSPEKEQELDKLIDELNDKNSPNFHHWLTADEFGERFGVAQQDIDTVTGWLQSHGFRINNAYASRMLIDISGTAGQIREAFHTSIHQLDVNGEMHFANMSDPRIPVALTPVIKGIASLNDFKPHPMYKKKPDYTFAGCATTADAPTEPGTCYAITAQDDAVIYNLNPLWSAGYSGQGQTIAVVEDTDTYDTTGPGTEWTTYRSAFGLSGYSGTYTEVHPGGCTDPGHNADDGEAAIDVEMATAFAPSATIELISCPSGTVTFGGQIALANLINAAGPYPGVVSVSYGVCEAVNGSGGNQLFYNTYQQAAAQGISVFGASGDEGASGCGNEFGVEYALTSLGVSGWTETPYNVSVGGTDFEDVYNVKEAGASFSTYWGSNSGSYGSALQYVPEIPWDDSCASALISEYVTGSFQTYGSGHICNTSPYDTTASYISLGAASSGASNCATGAAGLTTYEYLITQPECQGWAKPSWQSGSSLTGGKAVYGVPNDGVRDIPDVSMFAANGVWGHYETVCWNDPSYTSAGAAVCTGAPSTWSGFGGTSVASPSLAAIQALVNQKTGQSWGNPNPYYYQIAQNEYGTAGGTFQGTSCNSSGSGGPAFGCVFNDVTQGDNSLACENNGTTEEAHCYPGGLTVSYNTGVYGVTSTDNVTGATVLWGGSGYTSAPTCTIAGPSNVNPYKSPTGSTLWAGGTQATCTASVSSSSTTATWTIAVESTSSATDVLYITNVPVGGSTTCGPYTLSGASTTAIATALASAIGTSCSLASEARSGSTVTLTGKTIGAAGNYIVEYGPPTTGGTSGNIFDTYLSITNTVKGQGPNYVSSIAITGAGSGYAADTPVTLTGVGSGAVAVANTTPGTAAQSYQPAYGAAPGYDMATGLGSVNATNLVNSCEWVTSSSPGINSPSTGSALTGPVDTFCWGAEPGATNYWLDAGSTSGGNNYEQSGPLGGSTFSLTINTLPTNGGTVYVTLWYLVGGTWQYTEYVYNHGGSIATLTSPTPNGSMLSGSSQTFTWQAGTDDITNYWIDVGSSAGGNNYYQSGSLPLTTTSATVSDLPTDGSEVYVTLYSLVNGQWLYNSYNFYAFSASSCVSTITSPAPGSELTAYSDTFSWTVSSNPGCSGVVTAYELDAGTDASENYYDQSGNIGNVTTWNEQGLPPGYSNPPATGPVQMTLWNLIGGNWVTSPEVGYCANGSSGYPGCTGPPGKGGAVGGKRPDSKRPR